MQGQINRGSELGDIIYDICKENKYKTYCEIGTWNGRGTTKCIVDAINNKECNDNIFWSIEADNKFYNLAREYYKNEYSFLKLLLGTVNKRGIMSREEVENHKLFKSIEGHYVLHYENEYNSYNNSKYVGEYLNRDIDVVILDGGEFSTEGDFDFFRNKNVKVFILDDVNVIKCSRIREELLNKNEYELFKENLKDRNGWSIFIKK